VGRQYDPGGGVDSVKTRTVRPEIPTHSNTARIRTNQPRPNNVAAKEKAIAPTLRRRRDLYKSIPLPKTPLHSQQEKARTGKHDKGDDEKDQTQRYQRGRVKIAHRF